MYAARAVHANCPRGSLESFFSLSLGPPTRDAARSTFYILILFVLFKARLLRLSFAL